METDNAGTVQTAYNYGNDLISAQIGGIRGYYHYDGLGTVKQMTNDSETVVASYTYDGFGNVVASSGSVTNSYGFTGEQQFTEADNLVFLRARYYQPSYGRFISRDPIGYRGGLNLYGYVMNNPILYKDLLGLSPFGDVWLPTQGTGDRTGYLCCKKWGPSVAEVGGETLFECAARIMGDTFGGPIKTPVVIIIGLLPGGGAGLALDYGLAIATCSTRYCDEWGTTDSCGHCK